MIVVSDTSPLNYLVLLGADPVLPVLFGHVIAPCAVLLEMQHVKAPPQVQAWAKNPPPWLEIRTPAVIPTLGKLGLGESAAIALAQSCQADALLIYERDGTAVAESLGLTVIGTLAILGLAAERDLISLRGAIAALRATTFRGPEQMIEEMLRVGRARRSNLDRSTE